MKSVVIGAHLRREDIEPIAAALPAGALFLSAWPVAEQQPIGDRDLLLRVAHVRRELLERATFIAIRYGFTVTNESEGGERIAPFAGRWKALLEENRERVEMTLKVAVPAVARPDRKDFQSGAAYLKSLHAATQSVHVDDSFLAAVERHLVPVVDAHRWVHRDTSAMELVALVSRSRLEELHAAGETLKGECPSIPFLLSGPWPLEVFADADHE